MFGALLIINIQQVLGLRRCRLTTFRGYERTPINT